MNNTKDYIHESMKTYRYLLDAYAAAARAGHPSHPLYSTHKPLLLMGVKRKWYWVWRRLDLQVPMELKRGC